MLGHSTNIKQQEEIKVVETIKRALRNEHCHRCGGLMIQDHCLDVHSDSSEVLVHVLRCCGCGELIDPTILRNRLKGSNVELAPSSPLPDSSADSKRPVHQNSFTREILETWSAAMRQNEFSVKPLSN